MNENINLCEILKDCPEGTKLYSPVFGWVLFKGIERGDSFCPIDVTCIENQTVHSFCKDGRYIPDALNGECLLFPSKEERDWSKFKVKKPKFDPKTLQPFDKVLVHHKYGCWKCGLFSHFNDKASEYKWSCVGSEYIYCIPYNEDTKHLVGTTEEAPEFYRYWEV